MSTDYPIRISTEAGNIVDLASKQLEITSKKNVLTILIKAGAQAKGIKLEAQKK